MRSVNTLHSLDHSTEAHVFSWKPKISNLDFPVLQVLEIVWAAIKLTEDKHNILFGILFHNGFFE